MFSMVTVIEAQNILATKKRYTQRTDVLHTFVQLFKIMLRRGLQHDVNHMDVYKTFKHYNFHPYEI